ncbi:KH domain-containing protein 3-like [Pteronotus mesoamericanus]|uniref:KH domain-containing protein 3-like n=1 Tax=Pteronotus mesoamericanus TaxID=1884717 RepID=UPI0023ED78E6|nr:KH domain-containing protein 3-like [Pteronotus parnellii mesoamericanus]
MPTPKRFPTLVQLEQREGALFQMLSNITKRPYWFQSEYFKSPKAVHLEAWLVEAIYGPGGEHIPHVECVSQTLLRINQWDLEGEAEILIFGRPSYQKDVSKMIMNLTYYHRQLQAQSSGKNAAQDTETQNSPLQSGRRRPSGPPARPGRRRPKAPPMPPWSLFPGYEVISRPGVRARQGLSRNPYLEGGVSYSCFHLLPSPPPC